MNGFNKGDRVDELPWFNPGELVMCAKSGPRCWENGLIQSSSETNCFVKWVSDGTVSLVA